MPPHGEGARRWWINPVLLSAIGRSGRYETVVKCRSFNQLYPTAHSFLGYIDYVGLQNISSPNAGPTMSPIPSLSLLQYFFWRASDRDAFYNKTGTVLRPGTEATARYIGAQVDLLASTSWLIVSFGDTERIESLGCRWL